ncbi:MAG: hypothetical protein SFX72_08340 [Isosphaeraceae bacterium]|nr:hypothetical protein [Isosphaeraceae bacterium]
MSIVQRMRAKLSETMKARDAARLNFLRYWIAQLTKGDGTEVADPEAVKKMRGILKEARSGQTTFTPEEIALIQEWVPESLAPEAIVARLSAVADAIKAAPKEGMAMGIAMKALAGETVESEDVKKAIDSIRA